MSKFYGNFTIQFLKLPPPLFTVSMALGMVGCFAYFKYFGANDPILKFLLFLPAVLVFIPMFLTAISGNRVFKRDQFGRIKPKELVDSFGMNAGDQRWLEVFRISSIATALIGGYVSGFLLLIGVFTILK